MRVNVPQETNPDKDVYGRLIGNISQTMYTVVLRKRSLVEVDVGGLGEQVAVVDHAAADDDWNHAAGATHFRYPELLDVNQRPPVDGRETDYYDVSAATDTTKTDLYIASTQKVDYSHS